MKQELLFLSLDSAFWVPRFQRWGLTNPFSIVMMLLIAKPRIPVYIISCGYSLGLSSLTHFIDPIFQAPSNMGFVVFDAFFLLLLVSHQYFEKSKEPMSNTELNKRKKRKIFTWKNPGEWRGRVI